jgi:hypothetical protein
MSGLFAIVIAGWLFAGQVAAETAGPTAAKTIIDMHVHTAGIGAGGSGCFVAPALADSNRFAWYLRAFGVTREILERDGDGVVIAGIAARVAASATIDKAVVLAMDGVVDPDGELDLTRTEVYVPNEFIRRETSRYPNLLFGASINPYRPDAIERLRAARSAGAVLVKWIPAIMDIDPADPAIGPFYKVAAELGIPLLIHVGQERSFSNAADELGDPLRLVLPLELGVTVIAAHIATTGKSEGEGNFERLLPLFARYPNLFTDISSLTQINKLGYLQRALAVDGVSERMIYGSDWPLQFFPLVSGWYQIRRVPLPELRAIGWISNQWDRDVALKRAIGVPATVFDRSRRILGINPGQSYAVTPISELRQEN